MEGFALARIGIRREDKSRWEGRTPLVPEDVALLVRDSGVEFTVQRSDVRAIGEDLYETAGATIADTLEECPIVLGVKEIPVELFDPDRAYLFFSHTIKGQPANMPALARMMVLGCSLIDYERITDEKGRRLVFFGRFAGLAGMIDTLWSLGNRLVHEGYEHNPFASLKPAHLYPDLEHAQAAVQDAGERIRQEGLPEGFAPLVCGFAGYGQVSMGAQEIFDLLPCREVSPDELPDLPPARDCVYKVVFREEHLAKRADDSKPFELQEYYDHPERYRGDFFRHARYLSVLVNCIYWEERYPKLINAEQFVELYSDPSPKLRVIGDITCDIDGSLACTTRATEPSAPVYVYDPKTRETRDGVVGNGPVVLAVDFLPCELPVDASRHFSAALSPFLPALAAADFEGTFDGSKLPPELARATVLYRGRLTDGYRYLEEHLGEPNPA